MASEVTCACGQALPEWFKRAARCNACGGTDMETDQVWLKIRGVCTPFHKACVPVVDQPAKALSSGHGQ